LKEIQIRRDKLVTCFRECGFQFVVPKATFYIFVKSPLPNEIDFINFLADEDVFVLAGTLMECPGYFRVCLTASDEMVEKAIFGFKKVMLKLKQN